MFEPVANVSGEGDAVSDGCARGRKMPVWVFGVGGCVMSALRMEGSIAAVAVFFFWKGKGRRAGGKALCGVSW